MQQNDRERIILTSIRHYYVSLTPYLLFTYAHLFLETPSFDIVLRAFFASIRCVILLRIGRKAPHQAEMLTNYASFCLMQDFLSSHQTFPAFASAFSYSLAPATMETRKRHTSSTLLGAKLLASPLPSSVHHSSPSRAQTLNPV